MIKDEKKLVESAGFLSILMIVGGYLNAYTYITRGGVFANNQTGNMAKLGLEIVAGNWDAVIACIMPIIGCMLGAAAAAYIKTVHYPDKPADWRKTILIMELLALLIVGFIPTTVNHFVVNISLAFITSFQLSGFRTLDGMVCNTTICTGNLRSTGQFWAEALIKRDKASFLKAITFGLVVFSFALGAALGALISNSIGVKAIWLCSALIALLLYMLSKTENVKA